MPTLFNSLDDAIPPNESNRGEEYNEICNHCGASKKPIRFNGKTYAYHWCSCEGGRQDEYERNERVRMEEERDRTDKREKNYIRSGIPSKYLVSNLDVSPHMDTLLNGRSLYFVGSVGTRKTETASCIAKAAIDRGKGARLINTVRLFSQIKASYGKGQGETEDDILSLYSSIDLLILDDLGKEQPTEWALSLLFYIINERYERQLPIVITSQLDPSQIIDLYVKLPKGKEDAKAIASRLIEMCEVVKTGDDDARLWGKGKPA